MRRLLTALAALVALSATLTAQEKAIRPLDVPMSFSGTYGELRHNHFHGGLDWRVGGKTGDPIHVIKSGWISRASVSVGGYGNGLYVTHDDGTMSVYGHMLEFAEPVASLVKAAQYEQESFSVDLEFAPGEYPVHQGDVIGKVGNTGASAGPHLHMEVRDAASNVPMNYIAMGYYRPADATRPVFRRVCFYGLDSTAVREPYRICSIPNPKSTSEEILLPRESYVAVDAVDLQEGTTGKLAVEEYRVSLDGEELFRFKVGDVGFSEGSYIKSLIQYSESWSGGGDMVKSRLDPVNLLEDRITVSDNGGMIVLDDYDQHTLLIEASDEHGNRASLRYRIRRDDSVAEPLLAARDSAAAARAEAGAKTLSWLWSTPNSVRDSSLSYSLPVGALYGSINFTYSIVGAPDPSKGIYSDIWKIGSPAIPLNRSGRLRIAAEIPEELADKAYIATPDGLSYVGPVSGARAGFGTYCVAVDTEAPRITVDKNNNIRVYDAASGTASVRVEIDGVWHLSMLKRGRVTLLDRESIPNGIHTVRITATDCLGNESSVEKKIQFNK